MIVIGRLEQVFEFFDDGDQFVDGTEGHEVTGKGSPPRGRV